MRSDLTNLSEKARICTIIGSSGSGKTTLLEKLFSNYPDLYELITITTTRPKRSYEKQGEGYLFISGDEYDESKNIVNITLEKGKNGLVIPYKYGISIEEVERIKKKSKIGLVACGVEIHDRIAKIDNVEHSAVFLQISFLESVNRMFKRGDAFDSVRARVGWFGQESGLGRNVRDTSIIVNNEIELTKERIQLIHNAILERGASV